MALGPKAVILDTITPYSKIMTYSCADGNALSKGTLVELWDPFTVSKASAYTLSTSTTSGAFIGVVTRDKEANDGATQVAVLKEGRADIRCSGAVTKGTYVYCAGNDEVRELTAAFNAATSNATGVAILNAMAVGIAEEAGADGEVIIVRFNK